MIIAGLGIGFIPSVTWGEYFKNSNAIDIARIIPKSPHRIIYLNTPHQTLTDTQRLFSNEIANVLVEAQSY